MNERLEPRRQDRAGSSEPGSTGRSRSNDPFDSRLVIRAALPEDLPALEEIENDADSRFIDRFQPEQWWPAASGEERAASPGFILVAVDERGAVLGFVHVLEVDGIAHLEQLSVRRSQARRGGGRALVEAATSEGARRGYSEMTLRTYADVPWNAPFYASAGFRPSEPDTDFHRALVAAETRLGLDQYGRRLQMTAQLSPASMSAGRADPPPPHADDVAPAVRGPDRPASDGPSRISTSRA